MGIPNYQATRYDLEMAVTTIRWQNEYGGRQARQLHDARAWARLWKQTAKRHYMICGVLERAYKGSDSLACEQTAKLVRKDAEIARLRAVLEKISNCEFSLLECGVNDAIRIARAALEAK